MNRLPIVLTRISRRRCLRPTMTVTNTNEFVRPPASLSIREREFCSWLGKAEPGERVEYHKGLLATDRVRGMSSLGEKARRELCSLANRTQRLAEQGALILTQERHGEADYSYIAIKPQKPKGRW